MLDARTPARHLVVVVLTAVVLTTSGVLVAAWHASAGASAVSAGSLTSVSAPVVARRDGSLRQVSDDTLLVIGDSITSRFNDKPGGKMQGFWSLVSRRVGAEPMTRAQGGAGFVNPGLVRCKGYTFGGQLERPAVRAAAALAGALIIEGGRNDTRVCARNGGYTEVSSARLRQATKRFFADVRRLRGPDDCTIVFTPWGPKGPANRDRITRIVKRSAVAHGFTFVDTADLLTPRNSLGDRVHPNRRGNVAITQRLIQRTYLRTCFA